VGVKRGFEVGGATFGAVRAGALVLGVFRRGAVVVPVRLALGLLAPGVVAAPEVLVRVRA
jgi:hypothetical protein